MEKVEIEKNNKLIAEFMGLSMYTEDKVLISSYQDGQPQQVQTAEYNTSWEWLMPVIHKIKNDIPMEFLRSNEMKRVNNHLLTIHIEWTYTAVVAFLEWYNKENK